MLRIRPAQFDTFERAARAQFEDETVEHLRGFAPAHARGVGEDGLRTLIRLGLERAGRYGFTLRGPVRFYIELMVMFGSDFDTDPLLPWPAPGLRPGAGGELARADRLHDQAMAYRDRVIGPDFAAEAAAIRRLLKDPVATWLAGDHSDTAVEARMRATYPEKCDAAAPGAVRAVIANGRRAAAASGLPAAAGGALFAALMLAFGHGCPADPQFPWIADNLRDTAGQPGGPRVEKLATRAVAYLAGGLAAIEQG
jgi:hypothetical protein